MKQFWKYVLATVVGIVAVGLLCGLFGLITLGSIIVSSDTKPDLKEGSVLHIKLSGTINERSDKNPFAEVMGNKMVETQGLEDLLAAIKEAKTNKKISGIYLEGGAMSADVATLQELRKALVDFKTSKKFVYAYADVYSQGTYYVASAADNVMINPDGMIDWKGLASQPIFYTDLLKKVGVKMQVFKVGTYKSAVEPYILTEMSDANREQLSACLGSMWGNIAKEVAASRKVTVEQLNALADSYMVLAEQKDYLSSHLADQLCYADEVRIQLRQAAKKDKIDFVDPTELIKLAEPERANDYIAVYYAQGDIVDEAATSSLAANTPQIVGEKVVKDLDELANDDDVKAVVIRVNSGGGSAYASEQMWRAVQLLKKKKPVVVSMGGLAASGGYYMSCGADYIVAEPTTLTGSIGIFGMVPDFSGLATEKLGLHFDEVKTNKSAAFGSVARPFNADEAAAMQAYVNRGYKQFINRVANGRHMTAEQVDKIGQGRVWTGEQALALRLVDKLGTLNDAVAVAANRAGLTKYAVTAAPDKSSWLDQLLESTVKRDYMEERLQTVLGEYYAPLQFVRSLNGVDPKSYLQARMYFVPNFK